MHFLTDTPLGRAIETYWSREQGGYLFEQWIDAYLAGTSVGTNVVRVKKILDEDDLHDYQEFLAATIAGLVDDDCKVPGYLLAVPMAMGKTVSVLTAIARVLKTHPHMRFLIVAPLEVAKNTWPDEIEKWAHLKHITHTLVVGDAPTREKALRKDAQITIINRENLQWFWQKVGGRLGWKWQFLIYDESSRLKGFMPRTAGVKYKDGKKIRTRKNLTEFGVLAQARASIDHVVELSGTPSPNGLIDLGGQIFIIDQGDRLGHNRSRYIERYFDENQFSHKITPHKNAMERIMREIKDVMIGLRAEDYIHLPPLIIEKRMIKFGKKLMADYKQFERDSVSEKYDVEAVSRGVLINKLLQFANGGLYRKDPDDPSAVRETLAVHDLKLKELESIVEEAAGENILCAYSFQFDKERIRKKFPKAVFFDEEPDFVRLWNRGKIRLGCSHPASIGHGLNLQDGGHIQAWFGLTWSREYWDQFNRRLARQGQTMDKVWIYVIMATGTEDENQFDNLTVKGLTQDEIVEQVTIRLRAA